MSIDRKTIQINLKRKISLIYKIDDSVLSNDTTLEEFDRANRNGDEGDALRLPDFMTYLENRYCLGISKETEQSLVKMKFCDVVDHVCKMVEARRSFRYY